MRIYTMSGLPVVHPVLVSCSPFSKVIESFLNFHVAYRQ
jgi:hypothetical protein